MRTVPVLLLVAALATSPARADDLVLRTGRTISGRIVREDDRSVTIELASGTITFERTAVQEIVRGPAPAAPAARPAPPDGTAKPPAGKTAGQRPQAKKGATPAERLAAMRSVELAPWTQEESKAVEGSVPHGFKIVRSDGTTVFADTRPENGEGIRALYIQKDAGCGQYIEIRDGVRRTYWYRLYWLTAQRMWDFTCEELSNFNAEIRESDRIAEACCTGSMPWIEALHASFFFEAARKAKRAPTQAEREKLHAACLRATGSESAANALARFLEAKDGVEAVVPPAAKIAASMKRREALAALVALQSR